MNIIITVEIHRSIEELSCYIFDGSFCPVTPGEGYKKIQKVTELLLPKLLPKSDQKEVRGGTLQGVNKLPYWVKWEDFI
jgi:hypothetical protein